MKPGLCADADEVAKTDLASKVATETSRCALAKIGKAEVVVDDGADAGGRQTDFTCRKLIAINARQSGVKHEANNATMQASARSTASYHQSYASDRHKTHPS